MRKIFENISLVCGVIKNNGADLFRVFDPGRKLFVADGRAARVIREAQINHIRRSLAFADFGNLWDKAVLFFAGKIEEVRPFSGHGIILAGASGHDIRIDIYGIYGITYRDIVVRGENIADIAGITLAAVAYKYFVKVDCYAAGGKIILDNCIYKEIISEIRAVALKSLLVTHVENRLLHGLDHRRSERFCHISDSETDQVCIGVESGELFDFLGNSRKKIIALQLLIIRIQFKHIIPFLSIRLRLWSLNTLRRVACMSLLSLQGLARACCSIICTENLLKNQPRLRS